MIRRRKVTFFFYLVGVALLFAAVVFDYLQRPKFGALPEDMRLERLQHSPNYRDGKFHNQIPTPQFSGDAGLASTL